MIGRRRRRRLWCAAAALTAAWAGGVAPRPLAAQAESAIVAGERVAAAPMRRPFAVGERLDYDVRFSRLRVGRASMEVASLDTVRGRPAFRTTFRVKGGTWFYHVEDVLESWIDTTRFQSLRFVQDYEEGGRSHERRYEFFPERQAYRERADTSDQPSVLEPLDDGSFLYFVRTLPLEPGRTYEFPRYFRPDRNPVRLRVLRRERVRVPAGTFDAIVVQPLIKARGVFAEGGEARLWLRDDSTRILLQMTSKLPFGSLNLHLTAERPGVRGGP
ncbi:MAG: DUF3108 domain-containing protein [Gemmatimonadaceae bacterium]|jgi:hypothetical protein|nr:DUF3108 domain-containing protein [Gemmatimonadaceae bacterium]